MLAEGPRVVRLRRGTDPGRRVGEDSTVTPGFTQSRARGGSSPAAFSWPSLIRWALRPSWWEARPGRPYLELG